MSGNGCRSPPPPYAHPRTPNEATPLHNVYVQRKRTVNSTAIIIVLSTLIASLLLYIAVKINTLPHDFDLDQWKKEREEHDRQRKEWEREEKEHERARERQRQEQREREEQRRREEEKRRKDDELKKLGLFWGDLDAARHCLSYGVREYSARLYNLPFWSDWEYGCQNTPIEIKGKTLNSPHRCEYRGVWGGMYGHWLADSNEPFCTPYWGNFEDKGCTSEGSGLRRVESRLFGIAGGEDWATMCTTTPANIHGTVFEHPTYCNHKGIWGIYGGWELTDINC